MNKSAQELLTLLRLAESIMPDFFYIDKPSSGLFELAFVGPLKQPIADFASTEPIYETGFSILLGEVIYMASLKGWTWSLNQHGAVVTAIVGDRVASHPEAAIAMLRSFLMEHERRSDLCRGLLASGTKAR